MSPTFFEDVHLPLNVKLSQLTFIQMYRQCLLIAPKMPWMFSTSNIGTKLLKWTFVKLST